jgi:hypothetical protein
MHKQSRMPRKLPQLPQRDADLVRLLGLVGVMSMRQIHAGLGMTQRYCSGLAEESGLVLLSTRWVRDSDVTSGSSASRQQANGTWSRRSACSHTEPAPFRPPMT